MQFHCIIIIIAGDFNSEIFKCFEPVGSRDCLDLPNMAQSRENILELVADVALYSLLFCVNIRKSLLWFQWYFMVSILNGITKEFVLIY
jgi:hypothetical protein